MFLKSCLLILLKPSCILWRYISRFDSWKFDKEQNVKLVKGDYDALVQKLAILTFEISYEILCLFGGSNVKNRSRLHAQTLTEKANSIKFLDEIFTFHIRTKGILLSRLTVNNILYCYYWERERERERVVIEKSVAMGFVKHFLFDEQSWHAGDEALS